MIEIYSTSAYIESSKGFQGGCTPKIIKNIMFLDRTSFPLDISVGCIVGQCSLAMAWLGWLVGWLVPWFITIGSLMLLESEHSKG